MALIFDSGNSMFWDTENLSDDYNFLDIQTMSFKRKEVQLLSYVTDRGIVELDKLPREEYVAGLYEQDKNMSENRRKSIVHAYQRKRELLEQFQYGQNLTEQAFMTRKHRKRR